MGGVVRIDSLYPDAASFADLPALLADPGADVGEVGALRCDGCASTGGASPGLSAPGAADLPRGARLGGGGLVERGAVVLAQRELVLAASIEKVCVPSASEPSRAFGEDGDLLLGHRHDVLRAQRGPS